MSEYPSFGALLTQYLTEQDRTPAWLARRLGVNSGTVSRWLNDGTRPGSPEIIVRITDILGISAQRAKLLVAAGYGYQEANANAPAQTPSSPTLAAEPLHTAPSPPSNSVAKSNLVGRQQEWQALLQVWETVLSGKPRFVCLAGEPGIGKSRLAQELLSHIEQHGVAAAYSRAYAAEGHLAYDPVATWLRATPMKRRQFALADVWLMEIARLLPELLAEHPTWPPLQPMEQWQRRRFFEALARAFLTVPEPLLLVLDDLQWCDHETLEWLHYLLRFDSSVPLLVAGTLRPNEIGPDHSLHALRRELRRTELFTEMELGSLDIAETTQLVHQLVGHALDAERGSVIHQVTAGNPLFIEEIVRVGLLSEVAHGTSPVAMSLPLPSKVQAVIEARLVHLSPSAYTLVTWAATVGRSFTLELLHHASGESEETLLLALEELWQRRIVAAQAQQHYDFSHDLIREVVYMSLSPARRTLLHRQVAHALEEIHAADLDAASGQIADHYERAGLPADALPFYERAAAAAQRVYAHVDASHYLSRGLLALHSLPVTEAQMHQELRLQLALSASLTSLKGYSAPELHTTVERAETLSQQVGDDRQRVIVLMKKAMTLFGQGKTEQAYAVGLQRLQLVERVDDPMYLVEANLTLGVVTEHLGYLRSSQAHFEKMLAQTDYQWPHPLSTIDQHPLIIAHCHLGMVLWYLGYPDQARRSVDEALPFAQMTNHPLTQAGLSAWSGEFLLLYHDGAGAQRQAEATIALAKQWNFADKLITGQIILGSALVQQNQVAEGLALIRTGIEGRSAINPGHSLRYLVQLAIVYGQAGEPEKGLPLLEQALTWIDDGGERLFLAEVYRVRGILLQSMAEDSTVVESSFLAALEVARQQEAKSLELRAAIDLSRLWSEQGKRREAHTLLASVYGWFTEGFETHDLQQARALLTQLA